MLKIQKVKKDTSDHQSHYESSRWWVRLCKQLSIIFTRLILFVCPHTWKHIFFALQFVSSLNNKVLSHALQRIRSRVSPYLPAAANSRRTFSFGVFMNWWQSGWFKQEVGHGRSQIASSLHLEDMLMYSSADAPVIHTAVFSDSRYNKRMCSHIKP